MNAYQRIWTASARGLCAGVCLLALAAWSPVELLMLSVAGVWSVCCVALAPSWTSHGDTSTSVRPMLEAIRRHALMGSCIVVAGATLIKGIGGLTWFVLLLTIVTAPPVVRRFIGHREDHSDYSPDNERDHLDEPCDRGLVAESATETLSTPELVLAWRVSFGRLARAGSDAERTRIVAQRQEYLDELERRDRTGVQRWLASGARAGSDPTKFLAGGEDR